MIRVIGRALLLVSSIAMNAFGAPITYNITFTATLGLAPQSGSFTYDTAAALNSRFTNFTVIWDNIVFDFTNTANTGEQFFGTDCGTTPSSQSVFTFLSGQNVCMNPARINWAARHGISGVTGEFALGDIELGGFPSPFARIVLSVGAGTDLGDSGTGGFSIASIPEPSTWLLVFSCGVFVLLARVANASVSRRYGKR